MLSEGRVDYAFGLLIESWIEIRIATSFTYGTQEDRHQFEPSDAVALGPLLRLHQMTAVTSAEIRKDGHLAMVFADGAVLMVAPDERYEAFTITGKLPPFVAGSVS